MRKSEGPQHVPVVGRPGRRLLFLVTADWYFCSHRLPLALAAREAGWAVSVVTAVNRHGERIRDHGLELVPVDFPRAAGRPLADLALLARLPGLFAGLRPQVAHHVAIKPVLYGALASARARVPVTVNALAGLGYAFTGERGRARPLGRLLSLPLRAALRRRGAWTILQNADDLASLGASGLVDPARACLIRGSGVDTRAFSAGDEPPGPPLVLLASRMLWDKGVAEFVEAARRLRAGGGEARFVLVGDADPDNPASIPEATLRGWQREGVVEWLGRRDDMPAVMAGAHLVCLPSYREGLPKVLLEAASSGRAAVTTDVPGCREAVRDGETGLLVPPRDAAALAAAIRSLLEDPDRRRRMGAAARRLAVQEFSSERVNRETLALYERALASAGRR